MTFFRDPTTSKRVLDGIIKSALRILSMSPEERFEEHKRAVREMYSDVAEWDEYGQGYDEQGRCIVCICGARLLQPGSRNQDGTLHYCPADTPIEEER